MENGKITREGQMRKVQDEGLELFSRKNRDYGDAFVDYGVIGILVRLGDKIRRAQSITSKEVALVDTESIRDTLIDLHNYAAMAIMLMDEKNAPVEKPNKYDDAFINNNLPNVESTGHELSEMDNFDDKWGQFDDFCTAWV